MTGGKGILSEQNPLVPEEVEEYVDPRRGVTPISRHGDWPIAMRSTGGTSRRSVIPEKFRPSSSGRLQEFDIVQELVLEELQSLNASVAGAARSSKGDAAALVGPPNHCAIPRATCQCPGGDYRQGSRAG